MAMKSQMKQSSCIVLRPICFFIFLMLVVLSLAGLLIPLWIKKVARIENEADLIAHNTYQELFSRIQRIAMSFSPINSSAINLVRILSSSLDANDLQFSKIESKVASALFQALSTIPWLSQISYMGLDGLFFAYYREGDQPYALYSNSTFSSTQNGTENYTWYMQPANRDMGKLYGEAIKSPPSAIVNSSWFQEALRSRNGYASFATGWGSSQDILLLSTVGLVGKGAISLGFSMKPLIDLLISEIASYNGSLYLATMDGYVLTQGFPHSRMIMHGNQVSFQLLDHNNDHKVIIVGNIRCQSHDGMLGDYILSIWERKYLINCSTAEIAGLQFVYMLALPQNDFSSLIHKNMRLSFVLLILMIGATVVTICIFVFLIVEAARREMYLCSALINQMEATQQAERKSMNKSLAFASASHDIRASLAGICGLIEICRDEITKRDPLRSELQTNLLQMEACTRDLLGILNSILDTSKIEAGKMLLEEEEFDIEQLLEDVVDLYHPVGTKKGVDVILDPYDGSVSKFSCVKGDRGKLKQILSNLLSNAVKFTSEGHVTVRAWARKPRLENEILASNQNNSISCLFCLSFRVEKANAESEVVNSIIQRDPNCMEFLFEVNDTGKGIPKEKHKSVFENYVQVTETALGQEGSGLGLGIVQSLVRLMGGEIGIVDKRVGERGTCFRFSVFLSTCETGISTNARAADVEANGDYFSSDSFQHSGSIIRRLSPKTEGSQVVLFIQSAKRSTILRSFMQRLGIKVHVVKQHQQLSPTLKRIKQKLNLSHYSYSSSGNSRSDGYGSRASSTRSKEAPLSALDGMDDILHSKKKSNARFSLPGFILIVIDTCAGPFREITRAVAEFRRDLNQNYYSRVVWLHKPDTSSKNFDGLDEDKLPASDFVICKPFHGSRLYQTMRLLPEFGGVPPRRGETSLNVEKVEPRKLTSLGGASTSGVAKDQTGVNGKISPNKTGEIEEVGGPNHRKPLMGKKILVADDDLIGQKIATFVASQLGANIFSCENGAAAFKLVWESLNDTTTNAGDCKDPVPFDCILMDCEMPVMEGSEATARIREAEKDFGVRIPIIALTAHYKGEEIDKMFQAGVDGYITKPLNKDKFLKAISEIIIEM